jgi:hypothetical protein
MVTKSRFSAISLVADDVYPLTVEEYENAEILDDDVYVLITGEEVEVE